MRSTETRGPRLPDEPQEGRNRSWVVEVFSATFQRFSRLYEMRGSVTKGLPTCCVDIRDKQIPCQTSLVNVPTLVTNSSARCVSVNILWAHQVCCWQGVSASTYSGRTIIIDSMTSVFNTDASPPYNHDLLECFIVTTRTPLTTAQWGSRGSNRGRRVAPKAPKRFVISFILNRRTEIRMNFLTSHQRADPHVINHVIAI
ncbi:hypothetical protein T265_01658 [Opisthorchis viverrini]|uniref:Uncharacterized protein n=1 Tax=Opisthorchis viverrini TaxID=6198 RepID=A0A075A932_OPIVI|nr:hypothetical protein T265_01658 [Opisthorchis viverrini]KER32225.1 hypothetical protein T265_01658 [Opisthorchis viverrini]